MKKSTKRKEKAPSHPATQRLTLETFKYPSCLKEGRRGTQERRSRKNSHPLRNASQAVFLFSIATTLARRWDTEQNSTWAGYREPTQLIPGRHLQSEENPLSDL